MEPRALRYGLALLAVTVAIGPILPIYESRGMVAVEPANGTWESDQYVNAASLSAECRQLADSLAAGATVREGGYRFSVAGTEVLVKQTNVGGGWHRGGSFCLERMTEHNRIRIDGQVYEVTSYSLHTGRVSWLGSGWVLGLMLSLLLCLVGISERRNW